MRYFAWHHLFGLACWLATHGPRKADGDRWTVPLAKRVMRWSHPLYKEEWQPDW